MYQYDSQHYFSLVTEEQLCFCQTQETERQRPLGSHVTLKKMRDNL